MRRASEKPPKFLGTTIEDQHLRSTITARKPAFLQSAPCCASKMSPGLSMCAGCLRKTARRATSDNAVRGIGLLLLRQSLNSATRQYATTARAPSTTEPQRGQLAHIRPGTTTERAALGKLERNVRYTLKNMDDPYQVAQHVRQILGKGSYDEALLLTQTASRSMNAVVSWNHLIDYNLENQQLKQAIKLFNDVRLLATPASGGCGLRTDSLCR